MLKLLKTNAKPHSDVPPAPISFQPLAFSLRFTIRVIRDKKVLRG
jgi:hypothetical protein